jgi:hypothetical protein
MTPERLDKLADFYIGHALVLELIAEIRRLWPVLEAARKVREHFSLDKTQAPGHWHETPGQWDDNKKPCHWCRDWMAFWNSLDSYDSAAAQHPGQLTLGGGEESK